MQLNNIGKLSEFIDIAKSINGSKYIDAQVSGLVNLINRIGDVGGSIDDINTMFKQANISEELAKSALQGSNLANVLDLVDETGLTNYEKALSGLSNEGIKTANVFKGMVATIKPLVPYIAAAAAAIALEDLFTIDYGEVNILYRK